MTANINIRKLSAEILGMFVAIAMALFLSAGSFRWIAGWIFLILFFGFIVIMSVWLLSHDPDLLWERMTGLARPNQKRWDRVLMSLVIIVFIVWLFLMPLDAVRLQWSDMPVEIQAFGGIVLLISFYLFYLVIRENPYLSPAVLVQKEREQTVIKTGPYHYVRHPYYFASILFFLGTTLLLGSWYGLIPALILTILIVIRALMEEKTLQKELQGYDVYMVEVRYRFIPHIW